MLNEGWSAYVVGRMHLYRISKKDLAKRCGYTAPYISTVLNGKKKFESEAAKEKTKRHILITLKQMEQEILRGYRK